MDVVVVSPLFSFDVDIDFMLYIVTCQIFRKLAVMNFLMWKCRHSKEKQKGVRKIPLHNIYSFSFSQIKSAHSSNLSADVQ